MNVRFTFFTFLFVLLYAISVPMFLFCMYDGVCLTHHSSTDGGSTVTVTGSNFVSSALLSCKFGSAAAQAAVYLTASKLTCVSPAHGVGNVTVSVSNNGVDFSAAAPFEYLGTHHFVVTLQYVVVCVSARSLSSPFLILFDGVFLLHVAAAHVTALSPLHGPTAGGQTVTLTGTAFPATLVCRFGTALAAATVATSTRVTCLSPIISDAASGTAVAVEVSSDGVEFTDDRVTFTLYCALVLSLF